MSHDFVNFARAHGVDINPSKLYPGDAIRRCGTVDKPKSTNGAYTWDGERGFVWNWAEEAKAQWFEDPHARRWTEEEKKTWLAQRRASREDQEQRYRQAATKAQAILSQCHPGPHNYLHIKGFPLAQGLIHSDGALVIPMRNILTNAIQGLQFIRWDEEVRDYDKKMLTGMRAKGAVLYLGDRMAPETIVVEGFATGESVLQAIRSVGLRASVLVCFSAGNLEFVAPQLHVKACVFADNDPKSGQGEKSAKATGLPYCMSEVPGQDANDVHLKQGLMRVVQLIMQARRG